jgi:hypothetical protein
MDNVTGKGLGGDATAVSARDASIQPLRVSGQRDQTIR